MIKKNIYNKNEKDIRFQSVFFSHGRKSFCNFKIFLKKIRGMFENLIENIRKKINKVKN